ncbi:AAA family ATPase [Acinetobacter baumannii]|nr:AAA family ATPase [Acinetobacter baumannii]
MAYKVSVIQNYFDELIGQSFNPWMESFLNKKMNEDTIQDLRILLGLSKTSDAPSRAVELHRFGLIKYSISKLNGKGWESLKQDKHIINDIGYIVYYLNRVYNQGYSKVDKALSLIVSMLLMKFHVNIDSIKISLFYLVLKIKEKFNVVDNYSDESLVANILIYSGILSSVTDDKLCDSIKKLILDDEFEEGFHLKILNNKDKSLIKILNKGNINQAVIDYISKDLSIDNTILQRSPNYLFGNFHSRSGFLRSYYNLSRLHDERFINLFIKCQNKESIKSKSIQDFFIDTDEEGEVKDTFIVLENFFSENFQYHNEWSNIMQDIRAGVKEALRILGENQLDEYTAEFDGKTEQKIYYGCPGTGKSHKLEEDVEGKIVKRVTFHPDYDYSAFVGSYKPAVINGSITYSFIPQVFIKIYVEAWKNSEKSYALVIEEINRGNCAEIFGDLFQVLERDENGRSRYPIVLNNDLESYLKGELGEDHYTIKNGELILPANLSIYATMNTSDQSLFPIDSAFKRRWDWEYVPINYECPKSNFKVLIGDNSYSWLSFIKYLNKIIFNYTGSEDKQLGNWFVKPDLDSEVISEEIFINKVLYYIWHDVFNSQKNEIFSKLNAEGDMIEFSFGEICSTDLIENRSKVVSIINNVIQ